MRISRVLASAFVVMVISTHLFATTYYVSPSGSNNFSGTSPNAPWKTVSFVNNFRFSSGDSVLFLSGGVWREELIASSAGVSYGAYGSGARPVISGANLYKTGWSSAGNNVWKVLVGAYQPEQVWFNTVLGQQVSSVAAIIAPNQWHFQNTGYLYLYSSSNPGTAFTAPGIEAAQRDSSFVINAAGNITVTGLAFENPNYTAVNISSTATGVQSFVNDVWQGAQYEGLTAAGGTQHITSSEGLYNSVGIGIGGGNGATITNSILSGNRDGAIEIYGTNGPSSITSSTLTGNAVSNPLIATVRNYSPNALVVSNSILLPNPVSSILETYIGVTDDGTNVNSSPAFTTRAAPLIVVPYIDDYNNLGVAQAVSALAHQYGCSLSYALNTKLVNANGWAAVTAMEQAGDEIVGHTRSHPDLANNNVFTMQYTGAASSATMSISASSLQTFLNGSSTPDLNIDISDTYNDMLNVCATINQNPAYSCVLQDNQEWFTPALLASVSNINIKQPYLAGAGSNYLNWEIDGAIADIEANIPGYTVKSFATPFTSSNQAVEDHMRDAGIAANRNGILDSNNQPNGNWLLSKLDLYNMGAVWIPSGYDASKPTSSTAALVEGMGAAGGVIGIYAHGYDEASLATWQSLFQNLQNMGATCMTLSQATQYIKQNGTLVPDGTNKNWVRSVKLTPNFANTSSSPSQGAHGLQ